VILHVWPANQPTIIVVEICQERLDIPYNKSRWLKQTGGEDRGKGGGVRFVGLFSLNYIHVLAGVTQYVGISESSWYRLSALLF